MASASQLFQEQPRKPAAPKVTGLFKLPTEIVLQITRHLPVSSIASLTLSCAHIYKTLGTKYLVALRTVQPVELNDFLFLLERDLPDHILCYHCSILHLGNNPWRHKLGACITQELFGGVIQYIHAEFTYKSFQIIMKRHRLGLDNAYHLSCMSQKTTNRFDSMPYQRVVKALVSTGSLFLRVQEAILLPSIFLLQESIHRYFSICPHLALVKWSPGDPIARDMHCTIDHEHTRGDCVRHSKLTQCHWCPTEFRISLQSYGPLRIIAVITKYKDLGEGRTILDPKWWSHLRDRYTRHPTFAGVPSVYEKSLWDRKPVAFEAGSIYTAFEGARNWDVEPPLTPERVSELFKVLR